MTAQHTKPSLELITHIGFGKHEGASIDWVMLMRPTYALWIMNRQMPTCGLREAADAIGKMAFVLDRMPLRTLCANPGCTAPASGLFAPYNAPEVRAYCRTCRQRGFPNEPDPMTPIIAYRDAIQHVQQTYTGPRRKEVCTLALDVAEAKGAVLHERGGGMASPIFDRQCHERFLAPLPAEYGAVKHMPRRLFWNPPVQAAESLCPPADRTHGPMHAEAERADELCLN